jgi:hypothetical protein
MYSAPSVSFPVGRCRFMLAAAVALWLAGAGVTLTWWLQAQYPGWRQGGAGLAWLVTGLLAFRAWQSSPSGELHWDGVAWAWNAQDAGNVDALGVALDLQFVLLIVFWTTGQAPRWLWLERRQAPGVWPALRRAVYSRARNGAQREPQPAPASAPAP